VGDLRPLGVTPAEALGHGEAIKRWESTQDLVKRAKLIQQDNIE
jgi:hypothetical protein